MTKRVLAPTHFPFFDYKGYSFSLGLETSAGIWLSGHTASRFAPVRGDMVVEGTDLLTQARVAHEKIATILQAGGLGLEHVVRLVDYVTLEGMAHYPHLTALRQELFGTPLPVINTVVVKRLLRPAAMIEVEAVATRAGQHRFDKADPTLPGASAGQMGDVVYLTTQLPFVPGTRAVTAPGDIVGQARQIYDNAGQLLRLAGLGWDHVVKTVEFLTPEGLPRYRETGEIRRAFLGPHFPAATGIIMPRNAHPEALLQVDFVACRQPKQTINPGWARYQQLTYVPGVKAGHLLCLSGQGALHPDTLAVVHPEDVVSQTRYVYANLMRILEVAGVGPEAVVKTVEFITPAALPRYRETAAVRREFFQPPQPTATGVICEALLRPEMLIEVEAWAVIP